MKKASKIQIARNYAFAFYDVVAAEGNFEEVLNDCKTLEEAFIGLKDLKHLNNPVWKAEQKKELVEELAPMLNLSAPTVKFLQVIAQNKRIEDLGAILKEFKHIFYQKNNIKEITVESAQPLSAEQMKKLVGGLEKKLRQKVIADYIINKEILGGLIVRSNSVRIDDSLAGKLDRLEQMMKGKL